MADSVQTGSSGHFSTELSRELTLFHVTMMGVGMMIGAGIFIGIGNCLKEVGPGGTMLTFTLNALVALCSAMSYAELSSAVPRAGGAYNFARIGFGRGTSFFAGWLEWCASSVAGSLYAITLSLYVLDFLSQANLLPWMHHANHFSVKIVAASVVVAFVYINYRGASETGKIGSFFTLGQTLTLLVVALAGLVIAIHNPTRFENFQPFLPAGWGRILVTMGFIYVAFEGFEVIAQAGDETIEPKRNLPKAMLLSVVIVALTYVAVTFASVVAVKNFTGDWAQWIGAESDVFFARTVKALIPFGGSILVALAVIFAATSALNATIYSATRAVYALGRDRFLPGTIAKVSKRTRTPVMALIATAAILIVVVVFLPVRDVASSASIMFLFLFLLVNLCAIRMRRHMGDELEYGYIMPLFPLPPLLAIGAQIVLAVELREMSLIAWIVAPIWLVLGFLIYQFHGKHRVITTRDEIVTFKETPLPPVRKGYRMLVPVANPENALKIVTQTMKLAQTYDAQVTLVHMVPVPNQIPLSDAEQYSPPGEEAIAEAMLYLNMRFPLNYTVRYCRNPARGILSAAREHQADLIVMGWRGHSARRDFLFGSTVDPVLERNPCDVVILRECTERSYKNILVPFGGGPHSILALRVASILVDPEAGRVIPFNVTVPGTPTLDIEDFLEKHQQLFHCASDRFDPKHAVSKNVLDILVQESEEADLVIIGATGERHLLQFTRSPLPERLAKAISKPLIMVKAGTPVKSLVNRWI